METDWKKKYEEALSKARAEYENARKQGYTWLMGLLEGMFPDLKESEDEKKLKRIRLCLDECVHSDIIRDYERDECVAYLEKQKEQKPPITGNDFGWIDELKHDLEHPEELDQKVDDVLKQRKGIRTLEWSDTDNIGWDEAFACVTRAEKSAKNEEELQNAVTAEKWLKEIKFKYYVHPVKQEWSEEDEKMIERLIRHTQKEFDELCNDRYGHQEIISDLKESCRERMNWLENRLKSLRPPQYCENCKLKRSVENWKPSEHQMDILKAVKEYVGRGSGYWGEALGSLINDLEKLM